MATKTIGATARDYADVAAWIVYLEALTFTEDEIGEHYGLTDGEEVITSSNVFSSSVSNGSNRVILRAAAGESFNDHADKATNPIAYDASKGAGIRTATVFVQVIDIQIQHVTLKGMQFKKTSNYGLLLDAGFTGDHLFEECIFHFESNESYALFLYRDTSDISTLRNCAILTEQIGINVDELNIEFVTALYIGGGSSQFIDSSYSATSGISVKDTAAFGFSDFIDVDAAGAGSNNATDLAAVGFGSSNQVNLTIADEIESVTGGSEDLRAKSTGNLPGNGVALATTTDILEQNRANPPYIGCHEIEAGATTGNPYYYYKSQ